MGEAPERFGVTVRGVQRVVIRLTGARIGAGPAPEKRSKQRPLGACAELNRDTGQMLPANGPGRHERRHGSSGQRTWPRTPSSAWTILKRITTTVQP